MPPIPTVRHKAIQYLAMREHSYLELSQKLRQKEYNETEIDLALARLIDENLLSDERFGESFVRSRVIKGCGPMRIRHELKKKGLNDFQIDRSFTINKIDWDEVIEKAWFKKYSSLVENDAKEKARQWRFLQHRGFTQSQINALFRRINRLDLTSC